MMVTSRTVTAKADGDAMTLGELKAFVAACDGAGAANTTPVKATTSTWGFRLKSLTADAVRFGDPPA
jgi:hypothetical protein